LSPLSWRANGREAEFDSLDARVLAVGLDAFNVLRWAMNE